jgi:hypothetical protein
MRRYGYWQGILLSFYSQDFYRDVRQNWGSKVILYLSLVLLISIAPLLYSIQLKINAAVPSAAKMLIPQIPTIIFQNGVAKTPENKPYFIKDTTHNRVIGIIDTSGTYASLNDKSDALFLLTKNTVTYRDDAQIKEQRFPTDLTMNLNPVAWGQKLVNFSQWFWIIIMPICFLIAWIYRLLQSVIYATMGKLYAATAKLSNLQFNDIFVLAVVALTPTILLNTLINLTMGTFQLQWLIYIIVDIYYLVFAIKANQVKEI